MPIYRSVVTLESDTALAEDRAINTYAVDCFGGTPLVELAAFHAALNTLYQAIDVFLSKDLSGVMTITSYDLADPSPRVPVLEDTYALTPSTTALPAEVALTVSFQGTKVSGTNQARRRGRVFLGPLGTTINLDGRPLTSSINSIVAAFDALLTTSKAATWKWCVWSPTDNNRVTIDNGWVDNSFDTQRRRGIRPTTRTLFS